MSFLQVFIHRTRELREGAVSDVHQPACEARQEHRTALMPSSNRCTARAWCP
jgi:hypothetical protein